VIDAALADAIVALASAIGRAKANDLACLANGMAALARELEARRLARAGKVVTLAARRSTR